MANGNSFFSFLAGMTAGAAIAILTCTERGHEFLHEIEEKGARYFKSSNGFEEDLEEEEKEEEL